MYNKSSNDKNVSEKSFDPIPTPHANRWGASTVFSNTLAFSQTLPHKKARVETQALDFIKSSF